MIIRKSFLIVPKDIGALRYVSIEVVIKGAISVDVKLEEVGVLVGKHSDESGRLRKWFLQTHFPLLYGKLNPLTEASCSLVTLGPKSATPALRPVTPQRYSIPFSIVASLLNQIRQVVASTGILVHWLGKQIVVKVYCLRVQSSGSIYWRALHSSSKVKITTKNL